jgi:hypothetical protein
MFLAYPEISALTTHVQKSEQRGVTLFIPNGFEEPELRTCELFNGCHDFLGPLETPFRCAERKEFRNFI